MANTLFTTTSSILEDVEVENPRTTTSKFDLRQEASSLVHLTLPSVLVQLCLYFLFPQGASVVGRDLGTEALGGFSLGSLVGNLTCLSVVVGALTAADTLMPRAYGSKRYSQLGVLVVQSLIVCTLLLIPPLIPLCTVMETVLPWLGQDVVASQLAADWIRVYLVGLPPTVLFRVLQRFLVAQRQPWPPVYAAALPCFGLQPILVPVLVHRFGFLGSALAIVITQWAVTILLLLYLYLWPVHHPESWPTRESVHQAWKPRSLRRFWNLSLGGVLSLSEWWFWETMCFVAGSFGMEALCAHTIAYNIIPLLYMIPLGFSIGLTVRMGHTLTQDPHKSKKIAAWCMGLIVVLGALVAGTVYHLQDWVIQLFTTDRVLMDATRQIWPKVCVYIFVLYIFGINGAILRGLGMQWRVAWVVLFCLWCGLLPCVVYWAILKEGGLIMEWTLLPIFYIIMQVFLVASYTTADWSLISQSSSLSTMNSIRSLEDSVPPPDETTPLVA
jgi:MATE family multidrug resistance protein